MEQIHTITLSTFIDSSPFWSSFLAQLFATSIVVIIGSVILPPIWGWKERAKMYFFKANSNKKIFEFTKSKDGLWKSILYLSVRNSGRKTIERFYWEMYIENNLTVELVEKPPYPKQFTIHKQVGDKFIRFYGYVEMPIFPLDDIDFVYEVRLEVKDRKKVNIYYYFKTDYGASPVLTRYALFFRKLSWLKSLTIT